MFLSKPVMGSELNLSMRSEKLFLTIFNVSHTTHRQLCKSIGNHSFLTWMIENDHIMIIKYFKPPYLVKIQIIYHNHQTLQATLFGEDLNHFS